jgi:hypothetical protein
MAAGFASATLALFALVGTALAGGWAVTTIDGLPAGGFQAGQTYRLSYMIRQHGQTPFDGAKTAITIASPSGERQSFQGVSDGRPGHYVAEIAFPSDGEWSWQVSQYPFAPLEMGTITVAAAAASASNSAVEVPLAAQSSLLTLPAGHLPWLAPAILLALLLSVGLAARPVSGLVRRRCEEPAPSVPQVAHAAD